MSKNYIIQSSCDRARFKSYARAIKNIFARPNYSYIFTAQLNMNYKISMKIIYSLINFVIFEQNIYLKNQRKKKNVIFLKISRTDFALSAYVIIYYKRTISVLYKPTNKTFHFVS